MSARSWAQGTKVLKDRAVVTKKEKRYSVTFVKNDQYDNYLRTITESKNKLQVGHSLLQARGAAYDAGSIFIAVAFSDEHSKLLVVRVSTIEEPRHRAGQLACGFRKNVV